MKALALPLVWIAVACSPPASQPAQTAAETKQAPDQTAVGPIVAMGTVTAIDAAAGTVSLDHEAIPAIDWPAMSMQFSAEDRSILQGIAVGDRVSFRLKSATDTQVITEIAKQ